ncbi:TetR/AcrR family transcriptional regulator [Candidatus Poribacteria bacterium]|nr:TetR/AcrR family transcriptional regulator [Candidatus Poribacteria bacterium]
MAVRAQKKERKRRDILAAAVQVFARDGFHAARISDIADLAGVGHGTIYLYFETKEALLLTVFDELMSEAIADVKSAADSGTDASDRLRRFVDAQATMVEQNRALTALLLLEAPHTSRFLRSGALERIGDYVRFIEGIVRAGVGDGTLRSDFDPSAAATAIYAAVHGTLTQWLLEGTSATPRDRLLSVIDVMIHGMAPSAQTR